MAHDPLSPAEALRTRVGTVLVAVSLLSLVYSLVIIGQILFGVWIVLLSTVGPYVSYRVFAALDSLADAAQRIAAVREREADPDARFDRPVDRETDGVDRETDRRTERER